MSNEFRELLIRVGSGTHTSKNLTRAEAAKATEMMLQQTATPAQIGAFAIAHRIKRPTPTELAGILDTFDRLGKKLKVGDQHQYQPVVLGTPYDGRNRTVPVTVITALILAAANIPVVLHGGDCMPTKYGLPLVQIWQELGVNFSAADLGTAQSIYEQTKIGFIYLPQHFLAAHEFVTFREQIGKRPPFATAELAWCPIIGDVHLTAGFVHPPTEERFRETFKIRGTQNFTLVKGLEGSCDLSRNRTGIMIFGQSESNTENFSRFLLDPREHDLGGSDIAFESTDLAIALIKAVIAGNNSPLLPSAILNGGFYLWRFNIAPNLESGFTQAAQMLATGQVAQKLAQLASTVSQLVSDKS
ncbi:MAG: anthranilate phosphoribosyltransferase family protein [Cyanobacteria bacterium J06600_6]